MVMKSSLLSGFKPMTPLGFVIVVRAFASLLVAFLVERWTLSTMFWLFAIRLDEVASVLSLLKVLSISTFWGGSRQCPDNIFLVALSCSRFSDVVKFEWEFLLFRLW